MSIVITVDAKEMRKAAKGVPAVNIEVPGVIAISEAKCSDCGKDAMDINTMVTNAVIKGLAWMHAEACTSLENNLDLREVDVAKLVDRAMTEICNDVLEDALTAKAEEASKANGTI